MKITKQQLEKRIGECANIRVMNDFNCSLSDKCYMCGEVDDCTNGNYQNCDLYLEMMKGGLDE